MRTSICKQCGKKFQEDDHNPNIHYSRPATLCWHCKLHNKLKTGDWYQTANGEYHQKD